MFTFGQDAECFFMKAGSIGNKVRVFVYGFCLFYVIFIMFVVLLLLCRWVSPGDSGCGGAATMGHKCPVIAFV